MRPSDPPTPKGAATRAHLLQVAADLFADKGYAATRFSELITASGLTKGAFYFYFRSKSDLAIAVIADQETRWISNVQARVLKHADPLLRLGDVLPAMLDLIEYDPGAWSVVRLARELRDDPSVDVDVVKPVAAWITLLADIIRDGQQSGQLREDLDADELAAVLVGSFDGIKTFVDATATARADRTALLRRYAHTLGDMAFDGLVVTNEGD
ncbi:TetR/AcrR family transcriptional regulator [Gordonia sp. ABSL1-1]|uniref:TetR/AcrR family transcriptional regulator n=1 Tax=Gordonia sp. ABSL1-1 TaxID=3053923 RepID=UPI002573C76D|nr:TetR/AcrR family transcriptional regulator [Gordonia sp. ABSL1-1]MDL9938367.1 TetR/AcrR family transcriptional regulator [Gordonia sp. ABSL1-1]